MYRSKRRHMFIVNVRVQISYLYSAQKKVSWAYCQLRFTHNSLLHVSLPLVAFVNLLFNSILHNLTLCQSGHYSASTIFLEDLNPAAPTLRRIYTDMWTCFMRWTDGQKPLLLHYYAVHVGMAIGTLIRIGYLRVFVFVRHSEICSHLK
jgi:hypothetical protein